MPDSERRGRREVEKKIQRLIIFQVTYDTSSFLEKNKDFVVPEQVQMLEKSTVSFIKHLIPKQQQAAGIYRGLEREEDSDHKEW